VTVEEAALNNDLRCAVTARGRVSRKARFTAKRRPSSSVIITAAAYAHARLRARLQAVFYGPACKFRTRNTAESRHRNSFSRGSRRVKSLLPFSARNARRSIKSPKRAGYYVTSNPRSKIKIAAFESRLYPREDISHACSGNLMDESRWILSLPFSVFLSTPFSSRSAEKSSGELMIERIRWSCVTR